MKAIIQRSYGGPDTLELVEVPKPTIGESEVLVQIYSSNIASGDMRINTLSVPFPLTILMRLIFGIRGPRRQIRGISASGVIVDIGSKVTKYSIGDQVYFINSMKAGAMAEYIALKETSIMAPIPDNMSFDEAAPLAFGALSAYHFINKSSIHKDDKVLIYGASGSVGSYALQLAKYYGAEVTAVASEKNHDVLRALGADHTIDYQIEDFRTQSTLYDVILDAVGKITKSSCKQVIAQKGTYRSVKAPTAEKTERLLQLNSIIEEGKLHTLIDKSYSLEEFREAHIHTYTGHKVGNVVIQIKST